MQQSNSRWLRRLAGLLLTAAAAWLGLYAASECVPLPEELMKPLAGTPTLLDHQGRVIAELPSATARVQHPCSAEALGKHLPVIIVALEDRRFYEHHGVDWQALAASVWANLRAGRISRGGSTLTQQLIKVSTPGRKRSLWAKLYENLAALKLERRWTKEQILTAYLNRVDFGNRRLGAQAAAEAYFGRKTARLTFPEALLLAALPRAPTRFNPWSRPEAARLRFQQVLERLVEQKVFPPDVLASVRPPTVLPRHAPAAEAFHFTTSLRQRHPPPPGTTTTTLDLELQRSVTLFLQSQVRTIRSLGATHAAAVVLDSRTGAIRAMVGSADPAGPAGQINAATTFRSAGSTLKPFLYLRAVDTRSLTAATLLPDTQDAIRDTFPDYDPRNYDLRFLGPVRMREALACSLNVPAVVTLARLGPREVFAELQSYGLKFRRGFDAYGAGFILGNVEVRPLELAACFAAFSNEGMAVTPRWLEVQPVKRHRLSPPPAAAILADILCDNQARKRTFGLHSPLSFEGLRIPVKTGTSSGFRDAWTVGATREHSVAVWVGNIRGARMDEVASITGAAPLWRAIVDELLKRGDHGLDPPHEGPLLHQVPVCQTTGLCPGKQTMETAPEWFLPGSEPTVSADTMWRDTADGPALVLPSRQFAVWCGSASNTLGAVAQASESIRIISPHAGASFEVDPHIPAARQCLPLQAVSPPGVTLEWEVDGRPVIGSGSGFLWPLSPGKHEVSARAGALTQKQAFEVRSPLGSASRN
jgi:penicillin-binding protein 1C